MSDFYANACVLREKKSLLPVVPHHSNIIYSHIRKRGRCLSRLRIPVDSLPPPPSANRKGFPHPTHSEEHSTGLRRSPIIKQDHLPANRDPPSCSQQAWLTPLPVSFWSAVLTDHKEPAVCWAVKHCSLTSHKHFWLPDREAHRCSTKTLRTDLLLHDCSLTSDWLVSTLLKQAKKRGGDDYKKEETAFFFLFFAGALRERLWHHSWEAETKAADKRSTADKISLSTQHFPNRKLPLLQNGNTSAFRAVTKAAAEGKSSAAVRCEFSVNYVSEDLRSRVGVAPRVPQAVCWWC